MTQDVENKAADFHSESFCLTRKFAEALDLHGVAMMFTGRKSVRSQRAESDNRIGHPSSDTCGYCPK